MGHDFHTLHGPFNWIRAQWQVPSIVFAVMAQWKPAAVSTMRCPRCGSLESFAPGRGRARVNRPVPTKRRPVKAPQHQTASRVERRSSWYPVAGKRSCNNVRKWPRTVWRRARRVPASVGSGITAAGQSQLGATWRARQSLVVFVRAGDKSRGVDALVNPSCARDPTDAPLAVHRHYGDCDRHLPCPATGEARRPGELRAAPPARFAVLHPSVSVRSSVCRQETPCIVVTIDRKPCGSPPGFC